MLRHLKCGVRWIICPTANWSSLPKSRQGAGLPISHGSVLTWLNTPSIAILALRGLRSIGTIEMPPRSKIKQLPSEVKKWLDQSLIEGDFSGYELLENELSKRGFQIGKSSINRYGQEFEQRLHALKLATEQAKAISESIPDDAGAMNDALIRLVQQKAFDALLKMEEGAPLKEMGLMVARLSTATVKQKQWATEMQEKLERAKQAAASEAEAIAIKAGMSDDDWALIRAKFLGIEVN